MPKKKKNALSYIRIGYLRFSAGRFFIYFLKVGEMLTYKKKSENSLLGK